MAVSDINANSAVSVADVLGQSGARVLSTIADVTHPNGIAGAVVACETEFGGLDILVANAGIGRKRPVLVL